MASREVQLLKNSSVLLDEGVIPRSLSGNASDNSASETPLFLDVILRRWWLFGICVVISAAVSYFVATEYGKKSFTVRGSLMYTGLPIPAGPQVYQAPSLATYREILFSTSNMQRICDQHGLGMPPATLAKLFEPSIGGGSSILDLSLGWAHAEDGIAIMNDTMQLLIDDAAEKRKQLLREHMKHVEMAELTAKNEVDTAMEQLHAARRRRDDTLSTGGLAGDKYGSALEQINSTQAAIDALQVNQLGVEQRMARLDNKAKEVLALLRQRNVDVRVAAVRKLMQPYSKGSDRWVELRDVYTKIQQFVNGEPLTIQSYTNWKSKLLEIGQEILPPSEQLDTPEIRQLEAQLSSHAVEREKLEMELIPYGNQMALLHKRLQQYEGQAKELAGDITGVKASDLEDFEKKVRLAEERLRLVDQQLESMQELEQCRIKEFSILMPASMETVDASSNKRKLFVLALFAFSAILCAPVVAVELLIQRESPVARFASRWGLPVIAERLLTNYSPSSRKPADWRLDDAIRMTTLRIQQSLGHTGGVVLVSGLGNTPTPVKLMSAIAECLAQREERVLLVDAIDPSTGSSSLSSPVSSAEGQATARLLSVDRKTPRNGENTKLKKVFGLSDYLARECEGVTDLIQSTACPGVDLISAGANQFPSEAMASSCITELFEHCRNTYSMILVAGPPAVARADFQMLAARADAILLAADRASIGDPINRAVVQDLVDLRAPVIGIVA